MTARSIPVGAEVQIRKVGAYGGVVTGPLRYWFPGYRFVRYEEQSPIGERGTALVRLIGGPFEGCEVRYRAEDIRVGGKAYEAA